MFKEYESKPIKRKAYQIQEGDVLENIEDLWAADLPNGEWVEFKAHEAPESGGWIVQLTAEDTYYCSDKVFRERNIVEGVSRGLPK